MFTISKRNYGARRKSELRTLGRTRMKRVDGKIGQGIKIGHRLIHKYYYFAGKGKNMVKEIERRSTSVIIRPTRGHSVDPTYTQNNIGCLRRYTIIMHVI